MASQRRLRRQRDTVTRALPLCASRRRAVAAVAPVAALLLCLAASACYSVRLGPEPSNATTPAERIEELESRISRDRELLEQFLTNTDPPDENAMREVAWRLPENQRELDALREQEEDDGGDASDPEAPEIAPATDGIAP